jgi:peptidyl-prolyl cis-trans isomerase C
VSVSQPEATLTPLAPSSTPVPAAAQVNGEPINLVEYEAELALFRQAAEESSSTGGEERVLQDLIDQLLLAQAAKEAGFVVDDSIVQARLNELDLGDGQLSSWMEEYGYTDFSLGQSLSRSIAAAWMRDQIIEAIPEAIEQVHARQILLYNSDDAADVLSQLNAGADFATLAAEVDPLTSGDLGWFPRGYFAESSLTDAAFSLEPGEYSQVIETSLGYHILQLIDHNPSRSLSPGARQELQAQALIRWLEVRRDQSEIVILVP